MARLRFFLSRLAELCSGDSRTSLPPARSNMHDETPPHGASSEPAPKRRQAVRTPSRTSIDGENVFTIDDGA